MFDHLADGIGDVGRIEFLHGELYETAHKQFKRLYGKTSKRRSSAVNETVERHNGKTVNEHWHKKRVAQCYVRTNVSYMQ